MKTALEFKHITKVYRNSQIEALDDVSALIYEGEFITILGSSGSGKSTLLKMVNRLIEPTSGTIEYYGEDISKQDPVMLRRKIGYVIQQVGLFPHMTIHQNIEMVLKLQTKDTKSNTSRIIEMMELIGLDYNEYKDRYPHQLSGGEQQRVGLARGLAANPNMVLLDEPFASIDAINRLRLQQDILKIHQSAQKTFLFVTHDVNEALLLGSRVMVMDQGKIQQFGTPKEIISTPSNEFVEKLIGIAKQQVEVFTR